MTKIGEEIATVYKDTLAKVLKNMENCICFVLRERGVQFKDLLNLKKNQILYCPKHANMLLKEIKIFQTTPSNF